LNKESNIYKNSYQRVSVKQGDTHVAEQS